MKKPRLPKATIVEIYKSENGINEIIIINISGKGPATALIADRFVIKDKRK